MSFRSRFGGWFYVLATCVVGIVAGALVAVAAAIAVAAEPGTRLVSPTASPYDVSNWLNGVLPHGDDALLSVPILLNRDGREPNVVSDQSRDPNGAVLFSELSRVRRTAGWRREGAFFQSSPSRSTVAGSSPSAACCLGSECILTTETDCADQGGQFIDGALFCVPSICATGACCTDPGCTDSDGAGGAMTESLCGDIGGSYSGGATCTTDPCQSFRIPDGFEIIEVSSTSGAHQIPRINNCGQIVFGLGDNVWDGPEVEVFLYDNGSLVQVTDDPTTSNSFPDINDHGVIVWHHREQVHPDMMLPEIMMRRDATETKLGEGLAPSINNAGHVAWNLFHEGPGCPRASEIWYWDGESARELKAIDSHQSSKINDFDDITWTWYRFPCGGGFGDWTSDIMVFAEGAIRVLPSMTPTPQSPDIDNTFRVAWKGGGGSLTPLQVWQNGITALLAFGRIPSLNIRGDVAYQFITDTTPYQIWLYRDETFFRITTDEDSANLIDNGRADINDAGEIAWRFVPNGNLAPSGIRYMRRIRTGDVDLDDDVDLSDFGRFAECYTGPVITDGLCECRFLDIDHDRDVDSSDFDLFMENYTGEAVDCNGNTLQDRFDAMLAGTFVDCNANGTPDDCDLSGGSSQDINANATPDECDCPTLDTVGFEPLRRPKNRYLTIEPNSPGVSTAIRVTLTDVNGFEGFNGEVRWVGPPSSNPDENIDDMQRTMTTASLQCEPHYHNWGDVGRIHIHGAEIVPGSTYDVQTVQQGCAGVFADQRNYSEPFTFRTAKWGDMIEPFSGSDGAGDQPDFTDIAALVAKFTADPSAPDKARMQLQPNAPNPSQPVSFSDIASAIDAFTGATYPFPGPTACP